MAKSRGVQLDEKWLIERGWAQQKIAMAVGPRIIKPGWAPPYAPDDRFSFEQAVVQQLFTDNQGLARENYVIRTAITHMIDDRSKDEMRDWIVAATGMPLPQAQSMVEMFFDMRVGS